MDKPKEAFEQTADEIKIDVTLIPDYIQETLAAATLEFMKNIMSDPESRKKVYEKKKELGFI